MTGDVGTSGSDRPRREPFTRARPSSITTTDGFRFFFLFRFFLSRPDSVLTGAVLAFLELGCSPLALTLMSE